MSNPLVAILLGVLALVAAGYFALIAWRAPAFASALMHRGYEQKGWTQERLSARVRLLGVVGVVLALAAMALSVMRAFGA